MSYESECLSFVDNTYRPAYGLNASAGWPAPPPAGSSGATCAAWVDNTYRPWYDAHPDGSGGTGEGRKPPQPPKKN